MQEWPEGTKESSRIESFHSISFQFSFWKNYSAGTVEFYFNSKISLPDPMRCVMSKYYMKSTQNSGGIDGSNRLPRTAHGLIKMLYGTNYGWSRTDPLLVHEHPQI
jgi:hypothetical protein